MASDLIYRIVLEAIERLNRGRGVAPLSILQYVKDNLGNDMDEDELVRAIAAALKEGIREGSIGKSPQGLYFMKSRSKCRMHCEFDARPQCSLPIPSRPFAPQGPIRFPDPVSGPGSGPRPKIVFF